MKNPIIRGFYPDPSIIRVGSDYYIANSTFEWFPAITIHHSCDLINWRPCGGIFNDNRHIDLKGIPDSGGIWAPSLSYADGLFYMVYTIMYGKTPPFKDLKNFLVTAPSINGPWSEPIYLNSSGFDPSLFHAPDGSKWVLNIQWDFRKGKPNFGGIILDEYNPKNKKVAGSPVCILKKDKLIEGPNLYWKDGYYYLMLAEGGTGRNHSISMARAENITGPYELDPRPAVLTTRDNPEYPFQKAGHGEIVQAPDGQWYLAHLCSRPVGKHKMCILGRETALQECYWTEDGWLRLNNGTSLPDVEIEVSDENSDNDTEQVEIWDEFDKDELAATWTTLRQPADESWVSLAARKGWLRVYGGESTTSLFRQSLLVKRLQEFTVVAETAVEFNPTCFNHMAGLICWYDTDNHFYLRITHDEEYGKMLGIILKDDGAYDELKEYQVEINDCEKVFLQARLDHDNLQFYFSKNGQEWQKIGPVLEAWKLSDDYAGKLKFTGGMVGICVQDLQMSKQYADFEYFKLRQK